MLLATFHLEHEAVALADSFEEIPEMEVEAERIAAHSTEWTMPCVWFSHDDLDAVDETLAADSSIGEIVDTNEFDGEKHYNLKWSEEVIDRINAYTDMEASILTAEANEEGWRVQFRFVSRDQFDTFREKLTDEGYSITLLNLIEPGNPRQSYGELTPTQHDVLVAAYEAGYYDVPRETTARELADELDTSHQSVSEILRRGTGKLIEGALATTADTEDE